MWTANERKAERAYRTLINYGARSSEDLELSIVDLLTDIRHLLSEYGLDFNEVAELSKLPYEAEKAEEVE